MHTALVAATRFAFPGFQLSRNGFRMTANTKPVRQRMSARMSQQRKDTPNGQHDKADETHRLESNQNARSGKGNSYLRCPYVVQLQ